MPRNPETIAEKRNGLSHATDTTRVWVERWLSPARFSPYLSAANGDVSKALELYRWNVRLCQTLMGDISCFEVALRNAYDRTLRDTWNGNKGHSTGRNGRT